jgi:2'-5' RNA ligase
MLLPPSPVCDRIAATGALVGEMRSPIRRHQLHLTLAEVANLRQRCLQLVPLLNAALADHRLRACAFALARLVIEPGIAKVEPVGRRAELKALRSGLTDLLLAAGMPPLWSKSFNPHVTLGRGDLRKARRPIEPIFWSPDRIVLVESWPGAGHHKILESWPLLPPVQGSFDFG